MEKASKAKDFVSGIAVFLVALPLCLGIALASGAPLISGVIAGVVGGVLVGMLSGSHTSVSGPAAGLTTIVMAQMSTLGTFPAFLCALLVGGILQIGLGLIRAGGLSGFFPTSVIRGLLAAIGTILILKQLPHLLGHDSDPEGEFAFEQPDHENTFTEIMRLFYGEFETGALLIGIASLLILIAWEQIPSLKKSPLPSSIVAVVFGLLASEILRTIGSPLAIEKSHLVDVPVAGNWTGMLEYFSYPDWNQFANFKVYSAGIVLAIVASLETLLNLEAIDKLDPEKRRSPPNRELIAQGVGNLVCGLIGGIPVTSVIVRSSVNINAGGRSKASTVVHGALLFLSVVFLPELLNRIPLACLAAILIITGMKLASVSLFRQMWSEGRYQFLPFAATLVAIVLTDLMIGIGIGLATSVAFVLYSNLRRPIRAVIEKHVDGDIRHIQLATQVSFLNRAALETELYRAPRGSNLLLDAENTDFIDPDVISLLREFTNQAGPARGVTVSTKGFDEKFRLPNEIKYSENTTAELQRTMSPRDVLEFLRIGNQRFRSGNRLSRDLGKQVRATSSSQHPLAVILSCIDSRSPVELLFDLGLGDVFTIRIAGNVVRSKVMGSMEYACAVAGAKLILVMGHTSCGAVNAAMELSCVKKRASEVNGCQHLDVIVDEIQKSITPELSRDYAGLSPPQKQNFLNDISRENVRHSVRMIISESDTIRRLQQEGKVLVVGALYSIEDGNVEILEDTFAPVAPQK